MSSVHGYCYRLQEQTNLTVVSHKASSQVVGWLCIGPQVHNSSRCAVRTTGCCSDDLDMNDVGSWLLATDRAGSCIRIEKAGSQSSGVGGGYVTWEVFLKLLIGAVLFCIVQNIRFDDGICSKGLSPV